MYEASDIVTIGAAHEMIRGVKVFEMNYMDSEGILHRSERVDDIEEVDE